MKYVYKVNNRNLTSMLIKYLVVHNKNSFKKGLYTELYTLSTVLYVEKTVNNMNAVEI